MPDEFDFNPPPAQGGARSAQLRARASFQPSGNAFIDMNAAGSRDRFNPTRTTAVSNGEFPTLPPSADNDGSINEKEHSETVPQQGEQIRAPNPFNDIAPSDEIDGGQGRDFRVLDSEIDDRREEFPSDIFPPSSQGFSDHRGPASDALGERPNQARLEAHSEPQEGYVPPAGLFDEILNSAQAGPPPPRRESQAEQPSPFTRQSPMFEEGEVDGGTDHPEPHATSFEDLAPPYSPPSSLFQADIDDVQGGMNPVWGRERDQQGHSDASWAGEEGDNVYRTSTRAPANPAIDAVDTHHQAEEVEIPAEEIDHQEGTTDLHVAEADRRQSNRLTPRGFDAQRAMMLGLAGLILLGGIGFVGFMGYKIVKPFLGGNRTAVSQSALNTNQISALAYPQTMPAQSHGPSVATPGQPYAAPVTNSQGPDISSPGGIMAAQGSAPQPAQVPVQNRPISQSEQSPPPGVPTDAASALQAQGQTGLNSSPPQLNTPPATIGQPAPAGQTASGPSSSPVNSVGPSSAITPATTQSGTTENGSDEELQHEVAVLKDDLATLTQGLASAQASIAAQNQKISDLTTSVQQSENKNSASIALIENNVLSLQTTLSNLQSPQKQAAAPTYPVPDADQNAHATPPLRDDPRCTDLTPLAGYGLEGIDQTAAVVQTPTGQYTFSMGQEIPGAGTVQTGVLCGDKWNLVTSEGLIPPEQK